MTKKYVLKEEIADLKLELKKIDDKHKAEIERLKLKHTIELDETKHLVKLKEEKLDIEHEKRILKLKQEYKDKEMERQSEYHDKIVQNIQKAQNDLKEIYSEIMKRLPTVKVGVKQ